ncbi:MAG: hypothetical protein ACW987_09245 [Candidatus Thorarchaeota archaeon]|jgi:hypothetical protein
MDSNERSSSEKLKRSEDLYNEEYNPVSGLYSAMKSTRDSKGMALDLRIDIDARHSNSPILDVVSGDLYRFQSGSKDREYVSSWIMRDPNVTEDSNEVRIAGRVDPWVRDAPRADGLIVIPWDSTGESGPAEVTLTYASGEKLNFRCEKVSSAFRNLTVEMDICSSVNFPPKLPKYDTHSHSNHPPNLSRRVLDISEAYIEAGVDTSINPAHDSIDDQVDSVWRVSELHDAMEDYFSRIETGWPKWHFWLCQAGSFYDRDVLGIMFDYIEAPVRQGCALFRNHRAFADLPETDPSNDAEAAAMRELLYTCVHEIGHGFNLMHSWEKSLATPSGTNRADAESWMNYPQKYDRLRGKTYGDFWKNFHFRFDTEEILHIRHGDLKSVIFGGDPFSVGASRTFPDLVDDERVEFTIRSKTDFQPIEPVMLEFKLKNLTSDSISVVKDLRPELGNTTIYIQRPDESVIHYAPAVLILKEPVFLDLGPEEKHHWLVLVSFGKPGHYFDMPGEYKVKALYNGPGGLSVPSNVHTLRIAKPKTDLEKEYSEEFYKHETGLTLYLGGSDSALLKAGMRTLERISEEFSQSPIGANISFFLAKHFSRPFHALEIEKERRTRVERRKVMPERVIELVTQAKEQQKKEDTSLQNIAVRIMQETKAAMHDFLGEVEKAQDEIDELVEYLGKLGVQEDVVKRTLAKKERFGKEDL